MKMKLDPSTTKYLITGKIHADGVVEKPDVVGAIFGQTAGLIGEELDLRELQKNGRVGRIEVEMKSNRGKSTGTITLPTSLEQVETAILASSLETIDRIGPCSATIKIEAVNDVRSEKKTLIIERAKEIVRQIMEETKKAGVNITDSVRQAVQVEEIKYYGKDKCPGGPNVETSDAIIVVEGRNDVLNLLKYGIKNAIAVGGTNIPDTVVELSKERIVTAFTDGDRGGELILKELLQVSEVDFITRAPKNKEVEELTQKQIIKGLRNKIPAEQYIEMNEFEINGNAPKRDHKGKSTQTGGRKSPGKSTAQASSSGGKGRSKKKNVKSYQNIKPADRDNYRRILNKLSGKLEARLLDGSGKEFEKLQVNELASTLKSKKSKEVDTVIFDGVITQRLINIAASKKINTLIGVKKAGNVNKIPKEINVLTKKNLK